MGDAQARRSPELEPAERRASDASWSADKPPVERRASDVRAAADPLKTSVERRASDVRHAADLAAESPLVERRATHVRRAADAPDRAGCVDAPVTRLSPDAGRRTDAPVVGSADRRAVESPRPMRSPKLRQRRGNVGDLRLRRQKRRGLGAEDERGR